MKSKCCVREEDMYKYKSENTRRSFVAERYSLVETFSRTFHPLEMEKVLHLHMKCNIAT